ncbi:ApbE family lipoprotein [Paenibacillus vortex V453]|uniref:FAD:protein FMN transferase n=1 Tax=Paenibacillus vortex V453 TaxID=715225 RepID=A0A2R9T0K5_9BACL|nr:MULTISPECIES: FAD:protein FMN transferase [Paenibacillus]EFU43164.1 ApbE family lipoprotein [Paenibacillus vortex V453]MDH6671340.1 thiamine biosynthesis lipoprotein [Paenibacillus sp. LBL]
MYRTFFSFGSKLVMSAILLIGLIGCASTTDRKEAAVSTAPATERYFIFDTIVSLRVYDERMTSQHFDEVRGLLEQIDQRMNRLLAGSEIDQVNQEAGASAVSVSEETFKVVQTAVDYAAASGGHFDPTIGPIVDLWGIDSEHADVPEDRKLTAAMQKIDYKNVTLDPSSHAIMLKKKGMSLDLGAIAKGYAADVIADYLQQQDFKSAIIDLGGNVLAMGAKPNGSPWNIGIQDPGEQRGQHLGTLEVVNKTIVTSGVYERFFESEGNVYHHILSPFTGYPVDNDLLSVTIVTETSMDADAMSTSVFSLGLAEGRRFIESRDDAEAIFVTKDHQIYLTSGLTETFNRTNDDYQLAE